MKEQWPSKSRAKGNESSALCTKEGIGERNVSASKATFTQFRNENPCLSCPAPCCRMQLIPSKTPRTFVDIDHVYYMLMFPNTEMVVTATGDWFVLKWQDCREFEADTCGCKVHDSPSQPCICFSYNAYDCWYKKNFTVELPPGIYRLDLARFDVWVNEILFDDNGRIASAPSFEKSQQVLKAIPIEPLYPASMASTQDIATANAKVEAQVNSDNYRTKKDAVVQRPSAPALVESASIGR